MPARTFLSRFGRCAAIALACALPTAAHAADSVTASVNGGYARFLFSLAPAARGSAALNGNVLTIAFDRPVAIEPAKLQALATYVSNARIDPDRKTLRLVLAQSVKLHTSVSAANYAVDLAPTAFAGTPPDLPPPPKPPGPVDPDKLAGLKIRAGVYKDFTRVVFDWPKTVNYTVARGKDRLTVRFDALAKPDFSPLSRLAPPWVKAGDWHVEANRAIAVDIAIDPGSRTHDFRDGNHVVIDVLSPTADADSYTPPADPGKKAKPVALGPNAKPLTDTAAAQPTQSQVIADTAQKLKGKPDTPPEPPKVEAAAAPAPPPPPASDAAAQRTRDGAVLTFNNTRSAAVFMRGMTAWIVLDGSPAIDPVAIKKGLGALPDSVAISGADGATTLRITLKDENQIAVQPMGSTLKVLIGPNVQNRTSSVEFVRGGDARHASLTTLLPGATHVIAIGDPDAGDTLYVVPGYPGRAVLQPRDNLEFSVLATASGLAVVPHSDDLAVTTVQARVTVGRPAGLSLTPPVPPSAGTPAMLANGHDGPSYLDLAAWKRGPGKDFLAAERILRADITMHGSDDANNARLRMARFYLANDFAAEALGMIRIIQASDPSLQSHPQLLVMRAAANYMMGRYRDAHNDLAGDAFNADRHAAYWRALTQAALHDWDGARDAFGLAEAVVNRYPAEWQTRLRLAEADVALSSGHIEEADAAVSRLPHEMPAELLYDGELIHARLLAQEGRYRDASLLFAAVERGKNPFAGAQSVYYRTEAALAAGAISREQGVDALERLRFRWRGDYLELLTLRKLGSLYFAKQDWRGGLRTLRIATLGFPNEDEAREAQDDMRSAFEGLYLKGKADKLPPVQALALFYDFIDLTPIGPNGDEMIRRMSDRLVKVDLLGPAADLLKYQVEKRLDGVARAQVATRLAAIYLMDKKPEAALDALANSRISELPDDINHQRMLLEARALAGLKRWDQALDMVEVDDGADTRRLRADIYWESGNWAIAGQKEEELLGLRWSDAAPLNTAERNDVMRAAVAYSLANDQASLDRLRDRFTPKMKASPDQSAFAVVTQKIDAHGLAFRDAAAEIATVDTLKTFLADFRKSGT